MRGIAAITLAGSQLALQGVDAKDYLDIELVYRLRQKEPAVGFEDLVRETLATPYFQSNPNLLNSFQGLPHQILKAKNRLLWSQSVNKSDADVTFCINI